MVVSVFMGRGGGGNSGYGESGVGCCRLEGWRWWGWVVSVVVGWGRDGGNGWCRWLWVGGGDGGCGDVGVGGCGLGWR